MQQQKPPGDQAKLDPAPLTEYVPTPDGGFELYKAAGKLKGRKAVITGGDSGIGRATATLFSMEGADVYIAYLPEEKKDAQETKKLVEKYGQSCHLHPTDLRDKNNCKDVIKSAVEKLGAINILFNNHAYQMVQKDITTLPEEQWEDTFATNVHRKTLHLYPYKNTIAIN